MSPVLDSVMPSRTGGNPVNSSVRSTVRAGTSTGFPVRKVFDGDYLNEFVLWLFTSRSSLIITVKMEIAGSHWLSLCLKVTPQYTLFMIAFDQIVVLLPAREGPGKEVIK